MSSTSGGFGGGQPEQRTYPQRGVFVSHSSEDASLAEAFRELIQDVSAGMIPTYSSSSKDPKNPESGIPYGDDWFRWIEAKIRESGNVVALITPESVGRPWILFEAGFGRALENVRVFGLRLGTTGEEAYAGPFKAFQNSGSAADDLQKLCFQLFEGTSCNPREQTVLDFCHKFIDRVNEHFEKVKGKPRKANPESEAIFKALDEMKKLVQRPVRFADDGDDSKLMELDHLFHLVYIHSRSELDPTTRAVLLLGLVAESGLGWIVPYAQYAMDHPIRSTKFLREVLREMPLHRTKRTPFPLEFVVEQLMEAIEEHQYRRFRSQRKRWERLPDAESLGDDEGLEQGGLL